MDGQAVESRAIDVPSVLAGYGLSQPDNPAILAPGRTPLSYAALHDLQQYVKEKLCDWGVNRGDVVALILPKGPEMASALAVLTAGAAVFPLDPKLSADEYESLFKRSSVRSIIVPQGAAPAAREAADRLLLQEIDLIALPDAPAGVFELVMVNAFRRPGAFRNLGPQIAYILSTSGTTSQRKLIRPRPTDEYCPV